MTFLNSWRGNFRWGNSFRKGQDTATESIAAQLDAEIKYIIAELPTGVGKSDIAVALGKSTPKDEQAFVTTSQNILIDQYLQEFSGDDDFRCIKGKRHYSCKGKYKSRRTGIWKDLKTCEEGIDSEMCDHEKHHNNEDRTDCVCSYKFARDQAVEAKVAFTNIAYYTLGCRNPQIWAGRRLVVFDEAHNLADVILGMVEIEITEVQLTSLGLKNVLPVFETSTRNDPNKCDFHKKRGFYEIDPSEFGEYMEELEEELEGLMLDIETNPNQFSTKEIEKIGAMMTKVVDYRLSSNSGVRWIIDHHPYKKGEKKSEKILAKPLDTGYFAQKMLLRYQGKQFVFQSATIINPRQFCKEMGIPLGVGEVYNITKPSPFDLVNNRPIYNLKSAWMNKKALERENIDETMGKVIDAILKISKARPFRKGIVHTGSYKVMNELKKRLAETEIYNRCMFPEPEEREDMLTEHQETDSPMIIFSPSLTEGVDGKDDRLRFQIIVKIPYPYLGDRRVKIKADANGDWYNYQTAKTLIQAIGRGVRSDTDWCENFIVDAGFQSFANRARLPREFMSTVKGLNESLYAVSNPR